MGHETTKRISQPTYCSIIEEGFSKIIFKEFYLNYNSAPLMIQFLDELKQLNLPLDTYAIFGSGPLSVRGIRENHDLDILVTHSTWNILASKNIITSKANRPDSIYIGNGFVE